MLRISRVRTGPDRAPVDLLIRGGRVHAVEAPGSWNHPGWAVMDGSGLVALPGLRDDHLHIGAWLRSERSVPIRPTDSPEEVLARLVGSPKSASGWVVGFGIDHHQSWGLDLVESLAAPVLLVHRTGHAGYLNGAGARRLGLGATAMRVHEHGLWTRVLGLPTPAEELVLLGRLRTDLMAQGVVAVRDATPYPEGAEDRLAVLAGALAPIEVSFMGDPRAPVRGARHIKIRDIFALSDEPLAPLVPAVHAIEPHETIAALSLLAGGEGRVEHAALCPPDVVDAIATSRATVCANPGFLLERAAALASHHWSGLDEVLHPIEELVAHGVSTTIGSDAPVGRPGVLGALRAMRLRGSAEVPFRGAPLGATEATRLAVVAPDLVDSNPEQWVGRPANLSLWSERWFESPSLSQPVAATILGGVVTWRAPSSEEARAS